MKVADDDDDGICCPQFSQQPPISLFFDTSPKYPCSYDGKYVIEFRRRSWATYPDSLTWSSWVPESSSIRIQPRHLTRNVYRPCRLPNYLPGLTHLSAFSSNFPGARLFRLTPGHQCQISLPSRNRSLPLQLPSLGSTRLPPGRYISRLSLLAPTILPTERTYRPTSFHIPAVKTDMLHRLFLPALAA